MSHELYPSIRAPKEVTSTMESALDFRVKPPEADDVTMDQSYSYDCPARNTALAIPNRRFLSTINPA